jgi:predicted GNAT family N-acyltransferase
VIRIELMEWETARGRATPVRFAVFVEEQGVPAEIEMDGMDARSIHALAFHAEEVVGTARLLPDGHVGRMAVLMPWRNRGVGGLMLGSLMRRAKERGDREIVLSAQVRAVPFYLRHGFNREGPEYEEAGIAHQLMRRAL